MIFSFTVWFRNLMRPQVRSLQVFIYENNKQKSIISYDSYHRIILMKAVENLIQVPPLAGYWFDAEIVEERTCFNKNPPKLYLTCYKYQKNDPNSKQTMNYPLRYRHTLLEKSHILPLQPLGNQVWPLTTVKFRLVD
jgi:hypothetical protein